MLFVNLLRSITHKLQRLVDGTGFQGYVLYDDASGALLATSRTLPPMVVMQTIMGTTRYIFVRSRYPLASYAPRELPAWSWHKGTKSIVPTHVATLSEHLRETAQRAQAKVDALMNMITNLNAARSTLRSGIDWSEAVHVTKREQAKDFKKNGRDAQSLLLYPYVLQTADLYHLSPEAAADDILFRAKLVDDLLAKTELLRERYWLRIENAHSLEEIQACVSDFERDCFVLSSI